MNTKTADHIAYDIRQLADELYEHHRDWVNSNTLNLTFTDIADKSYQLIEAIRHQLDLLQNELPPF